MVTTLLPSSKLQSYSVIGALGRATSIARHQPQTPGREPREAGALRSEGRRRRARCVWVAGVSISCSRRRQSISVEPRSSGRVGGPPRAGGSPSSESTVGCCSVQITVRRTRIARRPSPHHARTSVCRVAATATTATALHPAHVHAPSSIHHGWVLHRASQAATPGCRTPRYISPVTAPARARGCGASHEVWEKSLPGAEGNGAAVRPVGPGVPASRGSRLFDCGAELEPPVKRPSRIVVACDVSSDRGGVEVEVDKEVRQISHRDYFRWLGVRPRRWGSRRFRPGLPDLSALAV